MESLWANQNPEKNGGFEILWVILLFLRGCQFFAALGSSPSAKAPAVADVGDIQNTHIPEIMMGAAVCLPAYLVLTGARMQAAAAMRTAVILNVSGIQAQMMWQRP